MQHTIFRRPPSSTVAKQNEEGKKCQQQQEQQQQTGSGAILVVGGASRNQVKSKMKNDKKKKETCSVSFAPFTVLEGDVHRTISCTSSTREKEQSGYIAAGGAVAGNEDTDLPCLLPSDVSCSESAASSLSHCTTRENSSMLSVPCSSSDRSIQEQFSSSSRSGTMINFVPSHSALLQRTGKTSSKEKKNVSFDTVEIHYHEIELGDNPHCIGPPLQIGWEPFAIKRVNIDNFEKWRCARRRHGEEELSLTPMQRHILITKTGDYKSKEIYDRMDEMEKVRKQRKNSVMGYKWRKRITNLVSW